MFLDILVAEADDIAEHEIDGCELPEVVSVEVVRPELANFAKILQDILETRLFASRLSVVAALVEAEALVDRKDVLLSLDEVADAE